MVYKPNEILVLLDDGHGWEVKYGYKTTPKFDDGSFIIENTFNHATKELLKQSLIEQGFNVFDVSPERTDTKLELRPARANEQMKAGKYKAYIFISIHFNSIGLYWDDGVGGIETYHYPGSVEGTKLAKAVHEMLLKGTDLKDRGVKEANLCVLRETDMPAILLECGFMSNHTEANLMRNIAYQQECATEVTMGVCNYFGITYSKPVDELERLTKIISPQYSPVWLKHFRANAKYNWVGFMESALMKTYTKP